MSFDKNTRSRLARFVANARGTIADEFTEQFQSLYGISAQGEIAPLERLVHLDDAGMATAALLRDRIDYLIKTHPDDQDGTKAAVARLAREQAFTILNRLAAIRMAEKRDLIVESVGKGYQSKGFKVYETVAGSALGEAFHRYRRYLFCLFDELAIDLGSLFDSRSPHALLFPRESALMALLDLLNAADLEPLWEEDETIGWIYQYYNDPAERKKMRDESAAPRNSRELAVRNQFFTPRYVVEFLSDNTLGRIWYEMTKGQTRLASQCRYLVRRPAEVFLRCLKESYRSIYGTDVEIPKDLAKHDAFAALYEGRLGPAADGKPGFFALAGRALSSETFEANIGESWDQHGNECIDELRKAILSGTDHPKKDDLVWVWAVVAQYLEDSQIGSPYAKEVTAKLETYFRSLLKQQLDIESLSQEDLLKKTAIIPHRQIKDPREIRLLDPACGSMHFGLYAFDLFEVIYEEAWDLAETHSELRSLISEFSSREEFHRQIPRLIIENNIHGIDIDPRAVQIAGLSLWLRAQKAWQNQTVKAEERPRVRRSNIVCAEPMPGSPEMLEEFTSSLQPALLGELVKTVFDKMQLAGDAGSLLKIEEEIRTAIEESRKAWEKLQTTTRELFSTEEINLGSRAPELSGIDNAIKSSIHHPQSTLSKDFWDTAEERIYVALQNYAESASSQGYQRRLFADDAARGFAFIDLCRKRYDAVVMNPPFGDSSREAKAYLIKNYPITKSELYAAFVERGLAVLGSGALGAITSRSGFFQTSFHKWRTQILLPIAPPFVTADLGGGVLDGAMVETAAYCLWKGKEQDSLFVRLGRDQNKGDALLSTVTGLVEGKRSDNAFQVNPLCFKDIPGSPFTYWVTEGIRKMFRELPPYESKERTVKQGLATADDFRFVRAFWEINPASIAIIKSEPDQTKYWFPYPKGGEFSPFYADIPLVVDWKESGLQYWHNLSSTGGVRSNIWMLNESARQYFFQPGLTYPRRLHRLAVMPMPTCSIISVRGSGIYGSRDDLFRIAGLFSSAPFDFLVKCMLGRFGHPQFDNGTLCKTPVPIGFPGMAEQLEAPTSRAISMKRRLDCFNELSHIFCLPASGSNPDIGLTEALANWVREGEETDLAISQIQLSIDDIAFRLYGFSQEDRQAVTDSTQFAESSEIENREQDEDFEEGTSKDTVSLVGSVVSYWLGCPFGRWDICYATGERQPPDLLDPFDPLPVCPPGMLQNSKGLPAGPNDVPGDYPLRISWSGILVDDENHPEDIVARVEDALKVIWKDRWEAIEQEACKLLGVKTLREYFAKPTKFFADHFKRYSKSRRLAPIYWPLSTKSGNYTLWIYYHRLSDQTLHTCLADFLDPKIRKIQSELDAALAGSNSKAAELREFLDELKDLHDEIERIIKLPWKPNLNDGVLITASPLWKLFRLPKWQKDLKACWGKLSKGDFDWAHLAYSIRPREVEKACEKDRSIAIAHGLEHLCKIEPPKPKKKSAKSKAKKEEEEPELIEED
jgi:hypothetical protein